MRFVNTALACLIITSPSLALAAPAASKPTAKPAPTGINWLASEYGKLKTDFQNKTNIDYSLTMSFMGQMGTPDGGKSIWQSMYMPTATWNMFNKDGFSGQLDFQYSRVQYWSNADGNYLGNNLNVASGVNDNEDNASTFTQLSYTQGFNNNMFELTVGQYPMWLFDGGTYDSNQQTNFINYALSQNGSSAYPSASFGGYATWNPTSTISLTAGMQDANNVDGTRINFHTLDKGDWTYFGSLSWNPTFKGWGSSSFSVMYYHQPSVEAQPWNSDGWSFNATQNINDSFGVFARFNTATGDSEDIDTSVVLGGVWNNPLGRNPIDQIGLAVAVNSINKNAVTANVGTKTRKIETVIEGYWAWGITEYIQITPDIQFYINPALDRDQSTATVLALRLTFML